MLATILNLRRRRPDNCGDKGFRTARVSERVIGVAKYPLAVAIASR
jgi:hypothetical protein